MTGKTVIDRVVIRFAGDSGDGMQLTGDRFTADSATLGNDISTFPNYPAEIRAPQGTLPGVSSFQVHFSSREITTPGDEPDVLVAMNPAALKANLADVARGGVLIVDTADFTARNLKKVGWDYNPLDEGTDLEGFHVHALDLTGLTVASVADFGLGRKDAARAKNMFALGLLSWMYSRDIENTIDFLTAKFAKKPAIRDANIAALKAGFAYGETTEDFAVRYEVDAAPMQPGTYRQISGNSALALGLIVGAHKAGLDLFCGTYPITPASDILHELAKHKEFNVLTFQAEDEIAGVCTAIGASFAGVLGVTTTSGPGVALKSEAMGLAVMTELPLVVVDVQRAGPSTGMPTKTEQSDLLQVMFGRNGDSPLPVIAAATPSDCFSAAIEACRIAVELRTPVVLLSDGYLANGAEPWRIPDISAIPEIHPNPATLPNGTDANGKPTFLPYRRDDETLARAWAIPGTPGLEHRIGGLEKADGAGTISYDPANHEQMTRLRKDKVERLADRIPELAVDDPSGEAEVLVLGWGSTFGPCREAVIRVRHAGGKVAHAHLRHLNPFPRNTGDVLKRYRRVLVPEMNTGQLSMLLRAQYLVDCEPYTRVRGLPISSAELAADLCPMVGLDPKEADLDY